jgi:hypothetical protein
LLDAEVALASDAPLHDIELQGAVAR